MLGQLDKVLDKTRRRQQEIQQLSGHEPSPAEAVTEATGRANIDLHEKLKEEVITLLEKALAEIIKGGRQRMELRRIMTEQAANEELKGKAPELQYNEKGDSIFSTRQSLSAESSAPRTHVLSRIHLIVYTT